MKCLPRILSTCLLGISLSGLAFAQTSQNSNPPNKIHEGLVSVELIVMGYLGDQPLHGEDIKSGKVGFIVAPYDKNSGLPKEGRIEIQTQEGKIYTPVDVADLKKIDKNQDGTVSTDEEALANVKLYPATLSPSNIKTPVDLILHVNQTDPITEVIYNQMNDVVTIKEAGGQIIMGKDMNLYMKGNMEDIPSGQ